MKLPLSISNRPDRMKVPIALYDADGKKVCTLPWDEMPLARRIIEASKTWGRETWVSERNTGLDEYNRGAWAS